MIAHWPRQIANAGQVVKQTTHLIDIMPTVLQATGTPLPRSIDGKPRIEMDGMSLLPALRGQTQAGHEELYFSHAKGKALRCGEWKLVQQNKLAWELYNIKSDPNELHNLADRLPEKVAALQAKWNAWQKHQSERSKL
jgi:arylsulfatase